MATVVLDREFAELVRQERAALGLDRWDEVWDDTYMMTPLPNIEHQEIATGLVAAIRNVFSRQQAAVLAGTNVSDRERGWKSNYRCPDIAVYLATNPAKNCVTHWCGGPDFAVEIVSEDDRSREKLPFYARVGTQELLIVDRNPWSLELFRLCGADLQSVGTSTIASNKSLASGILPLSFHIVTEPDRPTIVVTHVADRRTWNV